MDYSMGLLVAVSPWLFGFYAGGAETWVPVIMGGTLIGYSLLTKYELGVIRIIPMQGHIILDIVSGIVLASSPWIFGFSEYVFVPHLVFGILEIGAAVCTNSKSYGPKYTGGDMNKYSQNIPKV